MYTTPNLCIIKRLCCTLSDIRRHVFDYLNYAIEMSRDAVAIPQKDSAEYLSQVFLLSIALKNRLDRSGNDIVEIIH